MTTHVRVGGAWKEITDVQTKQSSAWKTVNNVYVRVGGVWKEVFVASFGFSDTISVSTANYNLNSELVTAGWNESDDVSVDITVNPAVHVYGTSTATAAMQMPSAIPAGSEVEMTVQGDILGKAGIGRRGAQYNPAVAAQSGLVGGRGLLMQMGPGVLTIINNGTIAGGGGGGGGGGAGTAVSPPQSPKQPGLPQFYGGGGGGGGAGSVSSPTAGGPGPGPGNNGGTGTNSPGAGGTAPGPAGIGGAGGGRGSAGGAGQNTPAPSPLDGKPGGAAGPAIAGYPDITFSPAGTIQGPTD